MILPVLIVLIITSVPPLNISASIFTFWGFKVVGIFDKTLDTPFSILEKLSNERFDLINNPWLDTNTGNTDEFFLFNKFSNKLGVIPV